jgi:hypothetical protein
MTMAIDAVAAEERRTIQMDGGTPR